MVPDRLAGSAFADPDAPFLIDDDRPWSYGEVDDAVAVAAGGLQAERIGPGNRVAVWGRNDVRTCVALLALARIGASAVPINRRLPASTAIEQADAASAVAWIGEAAPVATIDPFGHTGSGVAGGERQEREEAMVVFTSGSTGGPKGVRLSRGALEASAAASAAHLRHTRADRWLAVLPIYHVGGVSVLWRSAMVGASVRLLDGFDEAAVAEAVDDCSVASLVSPMLRRLLDAGARSGSLRAVLLGGGPIPSGLVEEAVAADWPVLPTYGQTEAGSQIATCDPTEPGKRVAVPLPGMEVRIADPDASGVGEIEVRGPALFSGYLGEPDRAPDAWHPTRDLGALDTMGHLRVVGRADRVIVTGGENVRAEAVEAALIDAGASDAVVVGVPDPEWGSVVAAVIVDHPPGLLAALRRELPGFAVPKRLVQVVAIPRTPMGKPDLGAVASLVEER